MITVRRQAGFTGWGVSASFTLHLHVKDLPLLYAIQKFFGVGRVHATANGRSACFTVSRIKDIISVIIPHFNLYPLQSSKSIDFLLWTQCVDLLINKEHLTESGLNKIIGIKHAINKGIVEDLKLKFKSVEPTVRPEYVVSGNSLNPQWVSGFTEGDGSFHVSISSKTNQVRVIYSIGLHKRDLPLILKIQEFFGGIGKISFYNNVAQYIVADTNIIEVTIKPHFDTYSLCGNKLLNYLIWKEILFLVKTSAHLTSEGLKKIKDLKSKLNQW